MSTKASSLFVQTPEDIVLNRSISSLSKDIYSFLQLQQFKHDRSDFTRGQIADEFGIHIRTVSHKTTELVEAGLLVIERKKSWCIYHIRDAVDHESRRRQAIKSEPSGNPGGSELEMPHPPSARKETSVLDVDLNQKDVNVVIEGKPITTIDTSSRVENTPTKETKRKKPNRYDHLSFGDLDRMPKPYYPGASTKKNLLMKTLTDDSDNDEIERVLRVIDELVVKTDAPGSEFGSVLIGDYASAYPEDDMRVLGNNNYVEWLTSKELGRPYLGAVVDDEQYDQRYAIAKEHGLRMVQ